MTPPTTHQQITINCTGDLIEHITKVVGDPNMKYWYRGQEDSSWRLLPSVFRYAGPAESVKEQERDHMYTFRSRAGIRYECKPSFEDIAGWISLMQHYGLPMRLLDWSRSPLVAAYFAVEKYLYDAAAQPVDACVWMLQPHLLNASQGFDEITLTIDSGRCRPELNPAFYHESPESGKVLAVMASETDLRMFVQQGAFTIHSTPAPLDSLQLPSEVLRQFVIPTHSCVRLAHELAIAGFRKGDIYPDLQNLAQDLSKFSPRLSALSR